MLVVVEATYRNCMQGCAKPAVQHALHVGLTKPNRGLKGYFYALGVLFVGCPYTKSPSIWGLRRGVQPL